MPTIASSTAQLDRARGHRSGAVSGHQPLPRPSAERTRTRSIRAVPQKGADRARGTYPAQRARARQPRRRTPRKFARYVAGLDGSVNGLALFACHGADLFEPFELAAPLDGHRLYVSDHAHLYPLARLIEAVSRAIWRSSPTRTRRGSSSSPSTRSRRTEQIESEKTEAPQERRMVAGALPAPYREPSPAACEGSRRRGGADRPRRRRSTRSSIAADEVMMPSCVSILPKEVSPSGSSMSLKLDVHAHERMVLEATVAALREEGRGNRSRTRRGADRRLPRERPCLRRASRPPARAGDGPGRRAGDHRGARHAGVEEGQGHDQRLARAQQRRKHR